MAYTDVNFKSKAEFKRAVAEGKQIRLYNPSGMFPTNQNGKEYVEGPHYPNPHSWYAQAQVVNGIVVKVS